MTKEQFVWHIRHFWWQIHGARYWPIYLIGLTVVIPAMIKWPGKIAYGLGRAIEIALYSCGLHSVIWFVAQIFNWLLKATSDPLLSSSGMKKPIEIDLWSFAAENYSPYGLMLFERTAIVVIAILVFKYRHTYDRDGGG